MWISFVLWRDRTGRNRLASVVIASVTLLGMIVGGFFGWYLWGEIGAFVLMVVGLLCGFAGAASIYNIYRLNFCARSELKDFMEKGKGGHC